MNLQSKTLPQWFLSYTACDKIATIVDKLIKSFALSLFVMAAMPFLCNDTLLFQGNLPRVLPVIIYKYASCFIPYITIQYSCTLRILPLPAMISLLVYVYKVKKFQVKKPLIMVFVVCLKINFKSKTDQKEQNVGPNLNILSLKN